MANAATIRQLLQYWRHSLADEAIMSVSGPSRLDLTPEHLNRGRVDAKMAADLFDQWGGKTTGAVEIAADDKADPASDMPSAAPSRDLSGNAAPDATATDDAAAPADPVVQSAEIDIPVVIATHAMTARRIHAAAVEGRSQDQHFAVMIPAILRMDDAGGDLLPVPDGRPWIARDLLDPVDQGVESAEKPVIGRLEDFDHYLSVTPFNPSSWTDLYRWAETMWKTVNVGSADSGFVEMDGAVIYASEPKGGATSAVRDLCDALMAHGGAGGKIPALLARIPLRKTSPIVLRDADRLERLRGPGGTMTAAHGLADSQALAMTAAARLVEGRMLAVNGPPGTGKTMLLQSIVASETVSRAIAGGMPALIVGTSANNQAVTNIIRAMNDATAASALDARPWARRWIEGLPSYGLYLPALAKLDEARRGGDLFAAKDRGGSGWVGQIPDKESRPANVERDWVTWRRAYASCYGDEPETPEQGVEQIRADLLRLTQRMAAMTETVATWQTRAQTWERAHKDIAPQAYLDRLLERYAAEDGKLFRERMTLAEQQAAAEHAWQITHLPPLSAARETARAALTAADRKVADLTAFARQMRQAVAVGTDERLSGLMSRLPFMRGQSAKQTATRRQARLRQVFNDWATRLDPTLQSRFRLVWDAEDHKDWMKLVDLAAARIATWHAERADDLAGAERALEMATKSHAAQIAGFKRRQEQTEAKRKALANDRTRRVRLVEDAINALNAAEQAVADLCRRLRAEYGLAVPGDEAAGADWLVTLDRLLDVTIRHELFLKAMRYWEGRWIIEARKLARPREIDPNDTEARLVRWSMLTPLMISTLYALPRTMRRRRHVGQGAGEPGGWKNLFMLGKIDLLIVDEAGQVAPHVGLPAFALARKAVVVGDIHQIEPIVTVSRGVDLGNARAVGLGALWRNGYPTAPWMVSASQDRLNGSLMRVIQDMTEFTTTSESAAPSGSAGAIRQADGTDGTDGTDGAAERGVMLTEHRRCDPDIIAYCNDLVYQDRLNPMTRVGPKAPGLRAWGWAHIAGKSRRAGSSRENPTEAEVIADWIAERATDWLAHYRGLDSVKYATLADIVAVVTPFRAQAGAIRKALAVCARRCDDPGIKAALSGGKRGRTITVGTVDALQGAERPIILFSPTYSGSDAGGAGGMFMIDDKPNRMNVAVSRAKDSFIVIGDMTRFRTGSPLPSSRLARYLFRDEGNEIVEIVSPRRRLLDLAGPASATVIERISDLDGHRAMLIDLLKRAEPAERLVIVSPWITWRAVEADNLPVLIADAIRRGVLVHIITDQDKVGSQNSERRGLDAVALLRRSGAVVHEVAAVHSKTILLGEREIIEGSFNWLSAPRTASARATALDQNATLRLAGPSAKAAVNKALTEFRTMGVNFTLKPHDPDPLIGHDAGPALAIPAPEAASDSATDGAPVASHGPLMDAALAAGLAGGAGAAAPDGADGTAEVDADHTADWPDGAVQDAGAWAGADLADDYQDGDDLEALAAAQAQDTDAVWAAAQAPADLADLEDAGLAADDADGEDAATDGGGGGGVGRATPDDQTPPVVPESPIEPGQAAERGEAGQATPPGNEIETWLSSLEFDDRADRAAE